MLNPTSLAKPHAKDQLQADIVSNAIDIASVTETWYKSHHTDQLVAIDGYNLFRRDRAKKRGGGVALYVRQGIKCELYSPFSDDLSNQRFELLWVKACLLNQDLFIGVLYHPPKSSYITGDLLVFLSKYFDHFFTLFSHPVIILTGDFNQKLDSDIT